MQIKYTKHKIKPLISYLLTITIIMQTRHLDLVPRRDQKILLLSQTLLTTLNGYHSEILRHNMIP